MIVKFVSFKILVFLKYAAVTSEIVHAYQYVKAKCDD